MLQLNPTPLVIGFFISAYENDMIIFANVTSVSK